jgi:5-methylcytosine-specific restriction endonuclease McrA
VPKVTPNPCSPDACGENYPRCGSESTYARQSCRCDSCRAAKREAGRRWREANPEYSRDHMRKRRAANPEKMAEVDQRWVEANRERVNEKARRYRQRHLEKVRERDRLRYDPVKKRESNLRWREANPEKVEQLKENTRRWCIENPEANRRNNQARRALLKNAFVEDVDRIVVFDRDNWTCQDCGIVCPKGAKFPEANFATLDHIVPLAKGGLHSYENSQTLCFRCNCRKGAR